MNPRHNLAQPALKMRAASPSGWDEFLTALSAYADKLAEDCVTSPVAHVQLAQGRAQLARELVSEFRDAPRTAELINRTKK